MARILIVEDNETNLDMLTRRLVRKGHDIISATDGLQGLEMAESSRPDLILMDLGLPEIDGLEATRRLKANAPTRDIPVIALTAHAMRGDREAALEAGCCDYDTKPVDFSRLTEKIDSFLTEKTS